MRILVADQNALLLAAIAATFGRHCDLVTSSRRDACLEQAERQKFDVVIACDKLADYTGLELLSEIAGLYPETLLIFAAPPARLERLGNRLELFGLLETLSYPLTPRKLLEVLQLANRIVPRRAMMRKVRHVVLESEWDTGERLGLIEQELQDRTAESHAHEGWRAQADTTAPETEHTAIEVESERDSSVDEFMFAAPPAAPPAGTPPVSRALVVSAQSSRPTLERASEGSLIELTPESVPVAPPAAATGHVSDEIEIVVSNDALFDQPEVPPEPNWAEDGAANDIRFDAAKTPQLAAAADTPISGAKPAPSTHAVEKRPKVRTPSKPTAAQLEAFERAVMRRNAERAVAGHDQIAGRGTASNTRRKKKDPDASSAASSKLTVESWQPTTSGSLSDLAKMATSKRPLADVMARGGSPAAPKRTIVVAGSGVAAVFVLGILTFGLLRTQSDAKEHLAQVRRPTTPFAASAAPSSGSIDAPPAVTNDNSGLVYAPSTENLTPAPPPDAPLPKDPMTGETPPDAAGMQPPPPPPQEYPGPMEPPSSMHVGPPLGMPGTENDSESE